MDDEPDSLDDDVTRVNLTDSWQSIINYTDSPPALSVAGSTCSQPAYFYALGVIIPWGFLCNIFCLIVFTLSAGLRRTTTGHYLTGLACADILFLVGDFQRWMNIDGCLPVSFLHTSEAACKIVYWLRYGAKMVSAWVTAAIATERFITVAFPLRVSRLSTLGRTKVVIVFLFVVSFSLGSFPFWTLTVDASRHPPKCVVQNGWQKHAYNAWSMAILRVGTLGLPGLLITVFTSVTVVFLMKASRRRREHMEGQPALAEMTVISGTRKFTSSLRGSPTERQLTITLVSVCVAFIILRLPYTVTYYMYETLQWKKSHALRDATKVTDVIATFNYVVNLFLYCLCGSYFRQQVLLVFGCRRRRKPPTFKKDSGESCKSRSSTITRMSIV